MGAARILNMILADKRISKTKIAEQLGKPRSTVYNTFAKDNMQWDTVVELANCVGCEVVLRDKTTGKIYE